MRTPGRLLTALATMFLEGNMDSPPTITVFSCATSAAPANAIIPRTNTLNLIGISSPVSTDAGRSWMRPDGGKSDRRARS